jgi:hypothetical protein
VPCTHRDFALHFTNRIAVARRCSTFVSMLMSVDNTVLTSPSYLTEPSTLVELGGQPRVLVSMAIPGCIAATARCRVVRGWVVGRAFEGHMPGRADPYRTCIVLITCVPPGGGLRSTHALVQLKDTEKVFGT